MQITEVVKGLQGIQKCGLTKENSSYISESINILNYINTSSADILKIREKYLEYKGNPDMSEIAEDFWNVYSIAVDFKEYIKKLTLL